MKKLFVYLYFFLFSQVIFGQTIIDNGGFFTEKEILELEDKLSMINKNTTVEILLYTTMDLDGKSPKDYGMELSLKYMVGSRYINNGILILMSKNDRKIQILNGYGLEWILSDTETQKIVVEMIPFLKKQEYYNGVDRALTMIENRISEFDWDVYKLKLSEVTKDNLGKILKFEFSNKTGNTKYKYAIDTDTQFSDEFKISLGLDYSDYDLYYTKYMNTFIAKILTNKSVIIYARLIDIQNKRVQLLGIE